MSEHDISTQMSAAFATHEAIIARGEQTFVEVGLALLAIRDDREYRVAGYDTFEDYCKERWGWGVNRSYQLIRAAAFTQDRLDQPDVYDRTQIPTSEWKARAMIAAERQPPAVSPPPTETEAETSARLLSYVGDPEGRVRRSRLRHAYSTAVHELRRDLLQLTVTSIVETLDASDRTAAERLIRDTRLWLDDFERALAHSTTLRLVGSEDDEARTAP